MEENSFRKIKINKSSSSLQLSLRNPVVTSLKNKMSLTPVVKRVSQFPKMGSYLPLPKHLNNLSYPSFHLSNYSNSNSNTTLTNQYKISIIDLNLITSSNNSNTKM